MAQPIERITFPDGTVEELGFAIQHNGETGMAAVAVVVKALIARIRQLEKEIANDRP